MPRVKIQGYRSLSWGIKAGPGDVRNGVEFVPPSKERFLLLRPNGQLFLGWLFNTYCLAVQVEPPIDPTNYRERAKIPCNVVDARKTALHHVEVDLSHT